VRGRLRGPGGSPRFTFKLLPRRSTSLEAACASRIWWGLEPPRQPRCIRRLGGRPRLASEFPRSLVRVMRLLCVFLVPILPLPQWWLVGHRSNLFGSVVIPDERTSQPTCVREEIIVLLNGPSVLELLRRLQSAVSVTRAAHARISGFSENARGLGQKFPSRRWPIRPDATSACIASCARPRIFRPSNPRPPRAVNEMRPHAARRESGAAAPTAEHSPARRASTLNFQGPPSSLHVAGGRRPLRAYREMRPHLARREPGCAAPTPQHAPPPVGARA
jgi:hypothetical protein